MRAAWLAAGLGLLAGNASATPGDCDAAAQARVLSVSADDPADARAAWLDARRLRWPGKPADARLALVHSREGRLVLDASGRVRGADLDLALPVARAPLPDEMRAAFRWLGDGAERELPATAGDVLSGQAWLVQRDADGRVLDRTRVQHAAALDDRHAAAAALDDLGARVEPGGLHLRLWAPTARAVAACVYDDDASGARAVLPMQRDEATGSWSLRVPGRGHGTFYTYLVDVHVPGIGWVRNRATDPYALGLGADSRRSVAIDPAHPDTLPPGWAQAPRGRELARATDAVLYELHVRDFSRDDATVPAADRGKYLGFSHAGSEGMRHLRAMAAAGLTDVHLLPAYDFGSVPERGCATPDVPADGGPEAAQAAVMAARDRDCFNWGYDPMHYTAPEGSFSSDPSDPSARIREFRAMVMALHGIGLRVGMDVVYNHTYASGQDARSVLDRLVPGYYHRLDAEGRVTQSTCCENTATEQRMMAKLMIDSAVAWVRHHRIDSFRFDLMGHQPRAAMERLQAAVDAAAGRRILLIGEGWDFGEVAGGARFVQASQRGLPGSGIGSFSDRMRDAVRGGGCCDSGEALARGQGWASGLHYAPNGRDAAPATAAELARSADLVRVGLAGTLAGYRLPTAGGGHRRLDTIDYAGQPAGFAAAPTEVVNYVENHDNLTLFDAFALKLAPGTPPRARAEAQVLALSTVFLAQGIAYFHAGGELLRSKSLDRNSFNSGDAFNRLDWSLAGNGFGIGLPPASDNAASWPVMRQVLADPSVAVSADEIRWTRDVFLDWLRLRASTPLLRLDDAGEVGRRLAFAPPGEGAQAAVVAAWIDGEGLPGAGHRAVAYVLNPLPATARVALPALAGRPLRLHPVQAAGRDARPRAAAFEPGTGVFTVPARTAVVFVHE